MIILAEFRLLSLVLANIYALDRVTFQEALGVGEVQQLRVFRNLWVKTKYLSARVAILTD